MNNIKDYLDWRGDILLNESHFSEVDNLILCELAYLDLSKIIKKKKMTLGEALTLYLEKTKEQEILNSFTLSQNPIPFYQALAKSPRFKDLLIIDYANVFSKKEEKQFSAITFKLNYNTIYVAFRGTDNTILGWKEDFNLSFLQEIPSQIEAMNYLNRTSFLYKNILVGGHSKGGNLAVYAAVKCKKKIQKCIKHVYNNDGPGFLEEFTNSIEYINILNKIITIVPESSIVGMLLTHKGNYKVVKSSAIGIWQHDALSWQVLNNNFITKEGLSETSIKVNETISGWLQGITKEERELFVNTLFKILENNEINTVDDLSKIKLYKIPGLLKSITKIDPKSKEIMLLLLRNLVKEAKKNLSTKSIFEGLKMMNQKPM